jgi:hypothetical protein
MLDPSTRVLLAALVALVAGVLFGGWFTLRGLRRRPLTAKLEAVLNPDELRVLGYLDRNAVRLASAQHWARGALLSLEGEAWGPALVAAAIAALACPGDDELLLLLNTTIGEAGADPQVANIWRQARGEVLAARERMQWPYLSGYRGDGSPDWNYQALATAAVKMLENAHAEAERRVATRLAGSAQT